MRCKDAQILINEYLDGTLDEAKRNDLFDHIHSCTHCKDEMEQLLMLKNALKSLPDEEPPAGLLSGAIAKAKFVPSQRKTRYFPRSAFAGIAAAIVITIGALWYFNMNAPKSQPADLAASKAEMVTGMETPAVPEESPLTMMKAAPAQSAAPAASSAAAANMAPDTDAARGETNEASSMNDHTFGTSEAEKGDFKSPLPVVEITVEAAKAKDLYADLKETLINQGIPFSETQAADTNTVSFDFNESCRNAIETLLKRYGIEQAVQGPATLNFVFKKS